MRFVRGRATTASSGGARAAIVALGGQAVLGSIVFWPLPIHMGSAVAGGAANWLMDVPLLMFVMGWESRALVSDPRRVFDVPMFAPAKDAALYGPTGAGVLPLFAPPYLATGNATLAINVALLGGLVLTAWTLHLVVQRWTGSHTAGLVAGAALLTTEWISRGWVPSAPSYAALMWFPLLVARVAEPIAGPRAWVCLAVLAWLQCLTDPVYVAPAVIVPLVVVGAMRVLCARTRRQGLAVLTAVVAAMIALVPLAMAYARVRAANPDLARQTTWIVRLPPGFPQAFLLGPTSLAPAAWVLLGVGVLLAMARRWRGERRATDAAWAAIVPWWIVGLAISIGPAFFWFDRVVHDPLVEWLWRVVPGLDAVRVTERWRVATSMASALGAGLAFAECDGAVRAIAPKVRPAWLVSALLALLVATGFATSVPDLLRYPIRPIPPPPAGLLAALAQRRGAVVEVPAPALDAVMQAGAIARALVHGRPILNGYSGYFPAGFPERMDLAASLPNREALGRLRQETGLETIVLHRPRLAPDDAARWQRELDDPSSSYRPTWHDGMVTVIDVVDGPAAGGAIPGGAASTPRADGRRP